MSWVTHARLVASGRAPRAGGAVMAAHRVFARPQGDPGLFSFLGKAAGTLLKGAVGFATGGPAGAAASLIPSIFGSRKTGASGSANLPALMPPSVSYGSVMPGGAVLPPLVPDSTVTTRGVSLGPLTIGSRTTEYGAGPGPAMAGKSCGAGFHFNKSSYYTRRGFVEAGSACVKNRRRNPLNPRALSRAMSRVTSARRAINSLVSFERVITPKGKVRIRRPKKRCA